MKILKVIHGYPPLYNAGSEVYSQTLCRELVKSHQVRVFTREENPFAMDFSLRNGHDQQFPQIQLNLINIPGERHKYRYSQPSVDQAFGHLLAQYQPDIVHIGHLNHLSMSMVTEAAKHNIPMLYTLHDYWLMCPRGQFIQRAPMQTNELWPICDGQEDQKCANNCYRPYFSGVEEDVEMEQRYWAQWIKHRMQYISKIVEKIDLFVAPSKYLYQRYINDFKLAKEKVIYLDYGFGPQCFKTRNRQTTEPFTFGYIGTHIPAKGIQQLLLATSDLKNDWQLRIWGRPRGQSTQALKAITKTLPSTAQARIEWQPEYTNDHIMQQVFNQVDCIIVPSIWVENSPLVIHEALQARIPVITANVGGMAEYIQHEQNGLLFAHRNPADLTQQMQRLIDDPALAKRLGNRGYLQSPTGNIPTIEQHTKQLESIYEQLITTREKTGSKTGTLAYHL